MLHLYRETLVLVRRVMQTDHRAIAEQVLRVVQSAAEQLPFTEEEQRWLKNGWEQVSCTEVLPP